MDSMNTIVAKNIKRLREEKKLSMDELAKLSGVSKSMLAQIERGDGNPTLSTLWKISNGMKVPFDALRFAVYYLELDQGSYWESEPHLKGTTEFITVFSGKIEIHADSQRFMVEKGESIRFRADTVHSYKNTGNETAILHMILFNP